MLVALTGNLCGSILYYIRRIYMIVITILNFMVIVGCSEIYIKVSTTFIARLVHRLEFMSYTHKRMVQFHYRVLNEVA